MILVRADNPDQPLPRGVDVLIGEAVHSYDSLVVMAEADRESVGIVVVPPAPPTVEDICRQVDAERDRRLSLDFAHDFGETPALDDTGETIEAGVRSLQMSPTDRSNWQALQGAALTAAVSGQPGAVLPMRAEDNWNVQTTASQVLQVLAAMTQHGAALLFFGGALKSLVREAADPASIDIASGWPG